MLLNYLILIGILSITLYEYTFGNTAVTQKTVSSCFALDFYSKSEYYNNESAAAADTIRQYRNIS